LSWDRVESILLAGCL